MTREQVEALLANLTRWDLAGDYEGDHSMVPCELDGEFVRFEDVREALEGILRKAADELEAANKRVAELEGRAAKSAELIEKAVGKLGGGAQHKAG